MLCYVLELELELVMYWRAKGNNIIPCLDDLLFLIFGYKACLDMARIAGEDMRLAGLTINWDKSECTPLHERLHLGFDVDLASGVF